VSTDARDNAPLPPTGQPRRPEALSSEIPARSLRLAYLRCRETIESSCIQAADGSLWLSRAADPIDQEEVDEAIEYLELRRLIRRSTTNPDAFRILEHRKDDSYVLS